MTAFVSAFVVFLALSLAGFLAGGGARRERLVWFALPLLASLAGAALYARQHAGDAPAELALVATPMPMTLPTQRGEQAPERTAGDMNDAAARLAARLEQNPNDGPGWALLARAYAWMGRSEEADAAFAKAARLRPGDAQLMADWNAVRAKKGSGGAPAAAAPAAFVAGKVSIAPLLATLRGSDTVFVIARAPGGSGPPLAVKRFAASDLPANFRLDESDAMMPSRSLAGASEVEIVARLSASGDAIRQPGDLESAVVRTKTGATDVTLVIGEARK
ncbi:MAG: tetratricopeptide repeat protein [Sphingomonadaceae bacterium]